MNGAMQQLEFDASRNGFVHAARGKWKVKCWFCGFEQTLEWWHDKHVGRMVRKLQAQGWIVGQNVKPKCFECNKRKDGNVQKINGAAPLVHVPPLALGVGTHAACVSDAVMNSPAAPKGQLPANPKLTRAIFALLEEHFDDKKRLYQDGWSDARVAKDTGASEAYVAAVRKGAFGELAEDPKVSALRGEIETLSTEIGCLRIDIVEKLKTLDTKAAKLQERVTRSSF